MVDLCQKPFIFKQRNTIHKTIARTKGRILHGLNNEAFNKVSLTCLLEEKPCLWANSSASCWLARTFTAHEFVKVASAITPLPQHKIMNRTQKKKGRTMEGIREECHVIIASVSWVEQLDMELKSTTDAYVLNDKNRNKCNLKRLWGFPYIGVGKWMEIICYRKPFSKNNKLVDHFLFLMAV